MNIKGRRGLLFVISSPSGAGKTTLSRLLLKNDDNLVMSISVTTRTKRHNEVDGVDYHFISQEKFENLKENNEFLEHAHVFGYNYGTLRKAVEEELNIGKDVLFDIDWQGAKQLVSSVPQDVVTVFILPPSINELEKRLKTRASDSPEVVKQRMAKAHQEISHWDEYDYVIVNSQVQDSLYKLHSILQAERLKRYRQVSLKNFITNLVKDA